MDDDGVEPDETVDEIGMYISCYQNHTTYDIKSEWLRHIVYHSRRRSKGKGERRSKGKGERRSKGKGRGGARGRGRGRGGMILIVYFKLI